MKAVKVGLAWILLTSSGNVVRWGGTNTATAAAFSLASIFPRKTDRVPTKNEYDHASTQVSRDIRNDRLKEVKGNTLIAEGVIGVEVEQTHEPNESIPLRFIRNGAFENKINGKSSSKSVHLQLQTMGGTTKTETSRIADRGQDDEEGDAKKSGAENVDGNTEQHSKVTKVRVHTFVDPQTNRTWVALNTSRRKFLAFLQYNNITLAGDELDKLSIKISTVSLPDPSNNRVDKNNNNNNNSIKQKQITSNDRDEPIDEENDKRKLWRELWEARQLLTDRTELLAVYQSDKDEKEKEETSDESQSKKEKRGGFSDLLHLYTSRLVAILGDEQQDERTPPDARYRSSLVRSHQRNRYGQFLTSERAAHQSDHRILIKWLEDHYGMSETLMLQARRFRTLPVPAQLELMNHFLEWFRKNFPYYYDRCDACGVSQKDEMASQSRETDCVADDIERKEEDDDDDSATFLGYIYPSQVELKGKASRTELYQCHKCSGFTRFPRYNSAFDIIQSKRGRCGEYSLLLYRFLRALNHDARWVVDWADHVWAEVLIGETSNDNAKSHEHVLGAKAGINSVNATSERWVHLDPCEAAVDKPLLYEEWGKKQTYIMALYAPLRYPAIQLQNKHKHQVGQPVAASVVNGADVVVKASLVEDVTLEYTSDTWENICKRRDETDEEVKAAIHHAIEDLENKLLT